MMVQKVLNIVIVRMVPIVMTVVTILFIYHHRIFLHLLYLHQLLYFHLHLHQHQTMFLYLMLSNNGPFNFLELLYTPAAMILAQTILITPVITALAYEVLKSANEEYFDQLCTLGVSKLRASKTILWESRYILSTVLVAGLGRAIGEVGAVMIVGGNINHLTRVMTTAIALETSRGNLTFALALGIILIVISLFINSFLVILRLKAGMAEGQKL